MTDFINITEIALFDDGTKKEMMCLIGENKQNLSLAIWVRKDGKNKKMKRKKQLILNTVYFDQATQRDDDYNHHQHQIHLKFK